MGAPLFVFPKRCSSDRFLSMVNEAHLVDWLRKIQLGWELEISDLARLAHIEEPLLQKYFKMNASELQALPTIPSGLEHASHLVGVYRRVEGEYPNASDQNEWLKKPNSVFEGNRPIDVMVMSPEHLAYISYIVESGVRLR